MLTSPAQIAFTNGNWATPTDPSHCLASLHVQPFSLKHNLAANPLFSIPCLIETAQAAAKRNGDAYIDAGKVAITDKWGAIPTPDLPIEQVMQRLETSGAWIIMKHVEKDPRYKAVLDEFTAFAKDLVGPAKARDFRNPEMLIIVTSPGRMTSYHFDAEINFLVQVHGTKRVWICDPNDRDITTSREIERYYGETESAGDFKAVAEERAMQFLLEPGDAVHIPSHGAHWVQNGDEVSVSLSLNFEFPDWKYKDPFAANHLLRSLGFNPKPPSVNPVANIPKIALVRSVRTAKALGRPVKKLARSAFKGSRA
jgi:hypothetical protein